MSPAATDQGLIKTLAARIARLEARVSTATHTVTATVVSVNDSAGTAVVTVAGVTATIHLPAGYRPLPGDVIQIQGSDGDLIVPPLTAGSVAKAALDPAVNADIAQAIADSSSAVATADGKVTAWYSVSGPTDPGVQLGDLWVDTSTGPSAGHVSQWSGSAWVAVTSAAVVTALDAAIGAQETADGKIVSFWQASAPTGAGLGDIWYATGDNNHPYRWSGSGWQDLRDGTIAAAVSAANTAQTSANGKNKITYSSSGPSGSGGTVGDTWFQTSSGTVTGQWLWNGSSWVAQTLTNVTVSSLDAGKITSGTLSAAVSITGPVYKTATSGQRIEIQPSYIDPGYGTEAALLFYAASGQVGSLQVQASSNQLSLNGVGSGAASIVFAGADLQISTGTLRNLGFTALGGNAAGVQMARFHGNLDSAGNVSFSHGLGNVPFYLVTSLVASGGAWQDGYSLAFKTAYNASTIVLTGNNLIPNLSYRVTVMYGVAGSAF